MGSGYSSNYSSTVGGSQPYSETYHVEPKMHKMDVENGTFHDGAYDLNPTARTLVSMINGNYIGDKRTNESHLPYVIDLNDNIIVGKRNGNGKDGLPTPHPTLIGGADPQVKMAGLIEIRGGKIYSYDDRSGHFKPNIKSMEVADKAFSKLPKVLFHKNFKKGGPK